MIAICRGVLLNLLLDFEFEIMRHYVAIRLAVLNAISLCYRIAQGEDDATVCDCNPINVSEFVNVERARDLNFKASSQRL